MSVYQWTRNRQRVIPTAPGQEALERDFYPSPPLPYSNKTLLPGSYHQAMSYPAGGGYPPTQLMDYDDLLPPETTMKGMTLWNDMPVTHEQSDFTSSMVVSPTALTRAILDGTSPPVAGPEYAGPYPRTNSVPFRGMFMRGSVPLTVNDTGHNTVLVPDGSGGFMEITEEEFAARQADNGGSRVYTELTPEQARVGARMLEALAIIQAYQNEVRETGGDPWKMEIVTAGQMIGQEITDVDDATFAEELEASLMEGGYDASQIAMYFAWVASIRQAAEDVGLTVSLQEAVNTMGGAVLVMSQEDVQERFVEMSPAQLQYWDQWITNLEAYLAGTLTVIEEEEPKSGIPTAALIAGAAAAAYFLLR